MHSIDGLQDTICQIAWLSQHALVVPIHLIHLRKGECHWTLMRLARNDHQITKLSRGGFNQGVGVVRYMAGREAAISGEHCNFWCEGHRSTCTSLSLDSRSQACKHRGRFMCTMCFDWDMLYMLHVFCITCPAWQCMPASFLC